MSVIVIKAARLAEIAHSGQKRKGGEPYIVHPLRVAGAVTLWVAGRTKDPDMIGCYEHMIAAAWLHDAMEDTHVMFDDIYRETSAVAARYVQELTNASHGSKQPRAARKAKDLAKLKLASKEAKIIKMFDRIDNLRDMPHDDTFAMQYAGESLDLADVVGDADADLHYDLVMAAFVCHRRNIHNNGKCLGCEKSVPLDHSFHKIGSYPGIPCLTVP